MHPGGSAAVFSSDRGASVTAMAEAFARWIERERGIGGVISAGGSGGTTLATAGMRRLPLGVPKVMVSTVASGQVGALCRLRRYHDALFGRRRSGRQRDHRAGARQRRPCARRHDCGKPVARGAGSAAPSCAACDRHDHVRGDDASGAGRSSSDSKAISIAWCSMRPAPAAARWRALPIPGLLAGIIDLTTTEVADMLVGGVFACDSDRFGAPIRTGLPYVGSVGAMDMVNFGPRETVPEKFRNRRFVIHNANVTLMRTTPEENRAIGEWIGERVNRMEGPVRLLLPEGGVSALDAPGKPFHDPGGRRGPVRGARTDGAPDARDGASSASRRTSTTTLSSRRWRRRSSPSDRAASGEPDAASRTPGDPGQAACDAESHSRHRDGAGTGVRPSKPIGRDRGGRGNCWVADPLADRPGDPRRDRRLSTALALPSLVEGNGVRSHRLRRRESRHQRRRIRRSGPARGHAGRHERDADRSVAPPDARPDHQEPHARRRRRRFLRARRLDARRGEPRRPDARPPHIGVGRRRGN